MKIFEKRSEYFCNFIKDLKIPVVAQMQALDLLVSNLGDKISKEENDLLKLTLSSCNHTNSLIEAFITLDCLEYEKLNLNYEKFDIVKLTDEIILKLDILFKYNKLTLRFKNKDKILVCADRKQIARVIENIIFSSINNTIMSSLFFVDVRKNKNEVVFEVKNPSVISKGENLKNCKTVFDYSIGAHLCMCLNREIINAHYGKMIVKNSNDSINTLGFTVPI